MTASSEAPGVETLRWRDGRLELIDQRLLPAEFKYVICEDAAQVSAAIRDMVVRGAPAIGCAAAFGMALEAARGGDLDAAFKVLAASRPTAVNLVWALERMRLAIAAGRNATGVSSGVLIVLSALSGGVLVPTLTVTVAVVLPPSGSATV